MGPVLLSMLCCVRIEGKEGQMPISTEQQKKAALNTIHDARHLRGVSQNLTAVIGDSVYFQGRPFKNFCECEYKGELKTNKGKTIINKHAPDNAEHPQRFDPYRNRTDLLPNCTLLLKNIQLEDKGLYLLNIDLDKELLWYNLDVIDPVCNISVAHVCTEDGVELQCNTTGNVAKKPFWTLNGQPLKEHDIFPEKVIISHERANGSFQCNVLCGVAGLKQAGINLTHSDCKVKSDTGLGVGLGIGLGIGFPLLVIFMVIFLYRKRLWCFKRNNGL